MSDLGQQIQQEIDGIKALQTKGETPAGQDGDPWATQYEAFVDAVQRQLDAAASQTALDGKPDSDTQLSNQEVAAALVAQSILNSNNEIAANVNNKKTVSDVGQLGELSTTRNRVGHEPLTTIVSDGAWTWHQDPRAVHDSTGRHTIAGFVNSNGDIGVGYHNHNTDTAGETILQNGVVEPDDHNSPTILVRDDGYIMVFWTGHGSSFAYKSVSMAPNDPTAFGAVDSFQPQSSHKYTYTYPYQKPDGTIVLFIRNVNDDLRYSESTDGGQTWTAQGAFVSNSVSSYYELSESTSPYRIDVAGYHAAGGADSSRYDLYHGYYDGSELYDSHGNAVGVGADITSLTQVYDSSSGHDCQVFDVSNVDGIPQIVFGVYPDYDEHLYFYADYRNGSWDYQQIVDGGMAMADGLHRQRYYSGLTYLSRTNVGEVFASIGDHTGAKIVRLSTDDGGTTWRSEAYTGSTRQNMRPVCPVDAHPDAPVVWMRGDYNRYNEGLYDTELVFGKESSDGPKVGHESYGGSRAYLSSPQDISGYTTVNFDETTINSRGEFDAANNQVVIKEYGLYHLSAQLMFSVGSDGNGFVQIRHDRNGTVDGVSKSREGVKSVSDTAVKTSAYKELYPGDIVSVSANVDGVSSATLKSGDDTTYFSIIQQ